MAAYPWLKCRRDVVDPKVTFSAIEEALYTLQLEIAALVPGGGSAWGGITGTLADQADLQTALSGKASASHTHLAADLPDASTSAKGVSELATSAETAAGLVVQASDTRLTDARTPLAHGHAIADVSSLQTSLDGKASTGHAHAIADTTGLQSALDGKEAANANLQAHVASAHAPADAQKNSDITKAEIEAKLTGQISSHTHAGGSEAFPVGAVFLAVVATNPATLLGYGTWSAFAAGRMLVGLDAGQTEFDTVEETGGAKTHTLTTPEIPAHTHVQDAHTHTQNAHQHNISHVRSATTGGATTQIARTADTSSTVGADVLTDAATAVNQNATPTNQNAGGGGAHNNLPPYVVVYMWKRTA